MRRVILAFCTLSFMVGCGSKELKTEVTESYPNGSKKVETSYFSRVTDPRRVVRYNVAGGVMSDTWMKDNKPDSVMTIFYKNGKKMKEAHYIPPTDPAMKEMKHGKESEWYENGQLKSEAVWDNGSPVGSFTTFYEDGKKSSETIFKDGKKDGEAIEYFSNGNTKSSTVYKAGRREGVAKEWYENGKIKKEDNFVDNSLSGKCVEYHDNGKKKLECNYKDGQLHGDKIEWNRSGRKVALGKFENGDRVFGERF